MRPQKVPTAREFQTQNPEYITLSVAKNHQLANCDWLQSMAASKRNNEQCPNIAEVPTTMRKPLLCIFSYVEISIFMDHKICPT